MVNVLQDNIRKTINESKDGAKKQISLVVEERLLQMTDVLIEQLKALTDGKISSRNQLFELAVSEYIREASDVLLDDYQINMEELLNEPEENTEEEMDSKVKNLAIFPARNQGFQKVFLGQHQWYSVRIAKWRIPNIKYVACYRTAPHSAITHYAEVKEIKAHPKDKNKYIIYFVGPPVALEQSVHLGPNDTTGIRGTRYTSLDRLLDSTEIGEL